MLSLLLGLATGLGRSPATAEPAAALAAWREAVGLVQSGAPRAAIPILEALVTANPDAAPVRLELGLAYALIEDDDKAQFHIRHALSGQLGEAERARAQNLLDRVEGRRRWSGSLGFAIVPQSNAGRRTETTQVMIGGLRFLLDETPESGTGLQLAARGAYTPRLAPDLWGRAAVSFFGTRYENRLLNDYNLRGELGLLRRADHGREIGAGLVAARRWLADRPYTDDVGLYAAGASRLGSATLVSLRGEVLRRSAPGRPWLEGDLHRFSLGLDHVLSPRLSVFGRGFATRTRVVAAHESGRTAGLTLGAQYLFDGGWQGGLEATVSRDLRDGPAPLFNRMRRDTETRLALRVLNRRLQLYGYAPVVELGHERRRSTLELFAFSNSYVSLGLDRRF